jgi:hypothetical protein
MIIGIDPHKMSHTANAVEPATNKTAASLRVDASLAGYRELMRWAKQFPDRRWAVENARGLGRHLAQWLLAAARWCSMFPQLRPPACESSRGAVAARPTSSMLPRRRALPPCTVMPPPWSPRITPPCSRYSRNVVRTLLHNGFGSRTNSTQSFAISSPGVPRWRSQRSRRRRSCGRSESSHPRNAPARTSPRTSCASSAPPTPALATSRNE